MQRIDAYAQQRVQQGMRRGATHHRHIPTQRSSSFHIVPVAPHLVTYVPLLLPLSKPLDTHMSVLSDRLFPSDDLTPGSSLPPSLPRSNSCSSSLQGKRRNSSRQLELRISSLMRLGGLASFCRWEISTRLAALLTLSHLSELSPHVSYLCLFIVSTACVRGCRLAAAASASLDISRQPPLPPSRQRAAALAYCLRLPQGHAATRASTLCADSSVAMAYGRLQFKSHLVECVTSPSPSARA
mmetsp:Transcript_34232/g.113299  ORF Transcript_34232/g.113299 Transcript_34232/m.113299 type:complete len:241 (-) Transcript_34232:421-1143(-)